MPDLRVALIGYGLAGRFFHAPLIASTPGLAIGAVVTSDPQRQAHAAQDHPHARVLNRDTELWEGEGADLVVIATPTRTHLPLATGAIERGIPVVVDKPLAVTAADAQALADHARHAGVPLTVFQNRRWDSDHLTLVALRERQALGQVVRYESRFERWRPDADAERWREAEPPERGGGVLLDLGSHIVDQALVLFGPVTHVYAEIDARRGLPSDDDAFVALHHAGGVLSHLRMSAYTAAPGPRLRVLGTEGALIISSLDSQEDALRSGARPDTTEDWGAEPQFRWGRLISGERSVPVRSERGDWPRFYALLAEALRTGGPMPVDPAEAIAALHVLERARESAARHEVVALPG